MRPSIYMDYNATAPIRPEAARAVVDAFAVTGNPSSVHGFGRAARRLVEQARSDVARLIGADPAELVFTSGGTEANGLALSGSGRKRLIVSAVEHASVLEAAPQAERIPVDGDGLVDLDALERLLKSSAEPALVSVMAANNETGVLQPVADVVGVAKAAGALVHCDAVQAAGRVALDFAALGLDLLSISAHKIGGPQGVGALAVRSGLDLEPVLRGGGQERRRRAGTENVPGIAGFGAAAKAALAGLGDDRTGELRDLLETRLSALAPDVRFFGRGAARLANTSCFALAGLSAETQLMALDLAGIAASAGSACSSGKVGASHVLAAMGVEESTARSAIRASLGPTSRVEHVERFVEAWNALLVRHKGNLAVAA